MCRLLGYCARDHASVTELIGEPSLDAFTALSAWHGDGWGMAARSGGAITVAKSPHRAIEDPDYQRLAKEQLGDTALAHNGAIHPQDRLPELLPPDWEQRLTSGTDSERYFLHIMSGVDTHGDVVKAVTDTVGYISSEFAPNSLNAILLGPDALYAIKWHNPELIPLESIRARNSPEVPELYFDLAYRRTPEALVVASTGWPQDGWTPLPNGSVLVVDRATLNTRVEPLLPVTQTPLPIPQKSRPVTQAHAA
jgi:predicted glutamine amidotransferase